jgi:hypothetical protein
MIQCHAGCKSLKLQGNISLSVYTWKSKKRQITAAEGQKIYKIYMLCPIIQKAKHIPIGNVFLKIQHSHA